MPTGDLDPQPSETTADSPSDGKGKPQDTIDYEAKYIGLNKAHSKALDRETKLKQQLEELQELSEAEIAKWKQAAQPFEKALSAKEKELSTLQQELQRLTQEITGIKMKETLRATVKEKYPNIVSDWEEGLLKERSSFATDEDYDGYLSKMNTRLGGATPEQPTPNVSEERGSKSTLGYVPRAPGQPSPSSSKARDINAIRADMETVNTRTAEGKKKMDALIAEMDAALG